MSYPAKTLILLFFLQLCFNYCEGQVKINPSTENKQAFKSRLIGTLGTDKGQNVHCGLQDKNGNLWFGTTGEGLYRYDGNSFTNFTTKDGLISNSIWSILEDRNGIIWLGTSDGICRFDGKSFKEVSIPEDEKAGLYPYTSSARPAKANVWSIMQDRSGKLWFATSAGVFIYHGAKLFRFKVDNIFMDNKSLSILKVEYILEDKAGNFWFGGRGNTGVFRYDSKTFTNFKLEGGSWGWPVLEDNQGNIWFSSWNGAYRYDGKAFTRFTKKEGLCSNNVTRIIKDKKGNLWFGSDSEDGGLCRYYGKTFKHFTTNDGLTHNAVWLILEDKAGNLWIGTRNMGLTRYDGKKFSKFSE